MTNKIFHNFIIVLCGTFMLQLQRVESHKTLKVDNCIFNCKINWSIFVCKGDCDGPTSYIDKKSSINDILEKSDYSRYAAVINLLLIKSNNIYEFNANYFCSINNNSAIKILGVMNNKLNDSCKIGLGDINNCENNNAKCEYAIFKLELYNNPLQILKNNSFCHLKNLTVLDLFNCSLNSIEVDAFKFNNKLEQLNLSKNILTEIPHLGHLSSLNTLNISNNLITSIKNEDFMNCNELEKLYLNGNRINNIEDNAFDQLSKLNALHLHQNQLIAISKTFQKLNAYLLTLNNNLLKEFNILDFSKNLKIFSARQNLITNVSSDLSNSQIEIIDLSENKIKSIDELQLPITATWISLKKNELQSFSIQPLNRTYSLRYIDLSYNKLQILANVEFQPNIYELNGNPIACSCENAWLFTQISQYSERNNLYGQPCSTINKYNPLQQSTFKELMLCESNFNDSNRCRVKHSNKTQFQCEFKCPNHCNCYTSAKFLYIIYYCSNSQLHSVPQWVNSGQLGYSFHMFFWLDGNNISQLTSVSFIDYSNVTHLYLNNSLIKEIDHFAFNNMTQLIILDLSHNLLTIIEENTFEQQIYLEKLLLSNNKLRQMPDNSFDNLKSIEYLYLHDNKLIDYPVWNLEKLSSLKELTISHNSWNCHCSFINSIYNFLKFNWRIVPDVNEINCVNGNKTFPVSYYYTINCLSPIKKCSIKCQVEEYDVMSINVHCDNPMTFLNENHDIDDIRKANCFQNHSSINAMEFKDSNLFHIQTNFFCPIDFLKFRYLSLHNNQLNDSTQIGFGDSSNCSSMYKCKFQTLETLILDGNPLKILRDNSFCHFTKLKELCLNNCSLETIEADAFLNLDKLLNLYLNDNVLREIPIVLHLNSLPQLSISNNKLISMKNIDSFKMLEMVDLSYNNIRINTLIPSKVANQHLRDLSLSPNKMSIADLIDFNVLNVEYLDLNYNQIEFFPKAIIPKTTTIRMRGNLITELEPFETNEMVHIWLIDLSRNQIKKINLPNLPLNLETIDLSHNQINQLLISKSNNQKIKEINLSNNSLNILPQTDIESKIFNLTNNPIACNCENSWLFKYPHWNQIIGQQCKIVNKFNPDNQTTLSSNMLCESNYKNSNRCLTEHPIESNFKCQFECPFPCYCYTTDDFSIVHYYCSNRQLKLILQSVHVFYKILNSKSEIIVWLNGNNFSEIRNENFTDYNNVTQLYMSNSQITSIDHLTFANMTELQILDLSYNKLTIIENGTFDQLMQLEKLFLSHNQIAHLPDNCFNTINVLKFLYLHNNKLTDYSIKNLSNRPILREIVIHNNSWTCNCSFIIEFQNFLIYHTYSVQNVNEIYCVNENGSLANSPVIQYNTSHCTDQKETTINNTWPIVIGVIAPLCVFAILYGVIRGIRSCVHANHAKKIVSAYRLMKNAGTSIETDRKVFDVFISYSNEDSDFVATEIVPKLEDINDPYHVCVHERNFLGGGSIEDTIIEAIKKSTRIIVILTENYLQSDWCMYEFIIAHSVMIEDQCPRVVLIIKDELPPDINPNLQIYLSTNTYIEWTDKRFWQRLHFALQSNKLPIEQTLQPMNFLMSSRFITPNE
ncbi:hypothetical protein CHUAL_008971 [Chamberlinius hualienensis]